ncbi:uncharacterized protein [Diadema setosum]|uniref:uncharacterized protein n=1 Tax=Diadema setosum TaxID=31175 RepID=UPI003B3B305A
MDAYTWCIVVLLIVVALVGIPGNVLVMLVYQRKAKRLSMNVYISGLAVVDLFVCFLSAYRLYFWIHESKFKSKALCQVFTWLGFSSEMITAFLTTAIAFDRYMSICKPHTGLITPVRALVSIVLCTVVSGLLSLVSITIYGIEGDKCVIIQKGLLLYVFATLTFSAFALLMVMALVLYWLVFREVKKRTKVGPRLIQVRPRNDNSSSNPQKPIILRSQSVPCSPTHGASRFDARAGWDRTRQLMISKQLNQRVTLVRVAAAFAAKHSSDSELDIEHVETVSIHQSAFLTTNYTRWDVAPKRSSVSALTLATPTRSRADSCITQLGSQIALNGNVALNQDSSGALAIPIPPPAMRRRRTGKMLLLATVVFVVTWTARCIMWLVEAQQEEWWDNVRDTSPPGFATLIVLQHLYYTTPAVNPIIYSYVNPRFRDDCAKLLKRLKCRLRNDL